MGTPCNFASYLLKLHHWYYHDLQRYPLDWIVPHLAAICKAYFMAITCLYYKNFLQQGLAYTIYRLGQGTFKNYVEKDQHPRRQHKEALTIKQVYDCSLIGLFLSLILLLVYLPAHRDRKTSWKKWAQLLAIIFEGSGQFLFQNH